MIFKKKGKESARTISIVTIFIIGLLFIIAEVVDYVTAKEVSVLYLLLGIILIGSGVYELTKTKPEGKIKKDSTKK